MSKKTLYWVFLVVFVVSGVGAQAHFSPFFEGKNRGVVQAFLPTSVAKVKDLFFSDAKTFVVRVTYQTNIDAQVAQLKGETAFSLSEKKLDTFAKEVLSSHLDKEILSAVNILTMEELRKQQPSYAHVTSKKVDPNIIYVSLKVTYMQQI